MTLSRDALQAKLDEVVHLLERHRVLESLAGRQGTEKRDLLTHMQRRENLVELRNASAASTPPTLRCCSRRCRRPIA